VLTGQDGAEGANPEIPQVAYHSLQLLSEAFLLRKPEDLTSKDQLYSFDVEAPASKTS
jgi:hypothetical protein